MQTDFAIPGYTIERELGRGAMGVVYYAVQAAPERPVAIKALSPELASDPSLTARFRHEAETVIGLDHPNIVNAIACGLTDRLPYIVLEYVNGASLDTILQKGPVSLEEAARIIAQVASGLDYAHARGVIHHDIKPANIILREDGIALLTDFGIAASLADRSEEPVIRAGSPAYMSPETCRGEPATPQSDLYSLGVVLYETVTGHLPFDSGDLLSLIYRQIHQSPPDPRQFVPDLGDGVCAVLTQSLAKSPEDRFPSASALAQAFSRAARFKPGPASRAHPLTYHMRRMFFILLGAAFLALGAVWMTALAGSSGR
ncbi:MAG: serine/threonine protein kinase [Armatimonadetes bacterium]|nr:serine/threonine protein kinase [Armatimonadota bacterium]